MKRIVRLICGATLFLGGAAVADEAGAVFPQPATAYDLKRMQREKLGRVASQNAYYNFRGTRRVFVSTRHPVNTLRDFISRWLKFRRRG